MLSTNPGPRSVRGLFFSALLLAGGATGAPYRPADDVQVLFRLPAGAISGRLESTTPADAGTAAVLARAYIARARQDGDPRFLGYAESALAPWWNDTVPPNGLALLRATLLQSRHAFDEALQELDALLAREPGNPQAQLTRATVLRVQGRYDQALAACRSLNAIAPGAPARICLYSVAGLSGQLPAAVAEMDRLEPQIRTEPAPIQLWYFAERAEMAERLGQPQQALELYRRGLAQTGGDAGLRAATADLLLELQRPDEARRVLGDVGTSELLLLRSAIAARVSGVRSPEVERLLEDSFAAARRRGDSPHLREEARFALEVQRDPVRALALAQQNWHGQREPADALVLARAAAQVGRAAAVAPLLEWIRETSMQDARLDAALAQVPR